MPEYVDNGFAPDINKYLTTDYKSRVSEGVYAEDTAFSDNGLHAIAVQTTGPIFFYNKTMFDSLGIECPTTWDEVTEASKKIYEAYIPGFAFDSLTDGFQTLLMQGGGEYVDLENKKVLFNTPEFEASVEWFAEGVKAGYFGLAPVTGDYFSSDMSSLKLASYAGSSAGLPYLNLDEDNELAAAPMPKTAGGVDWVPGWNRSALVFSSNEAQEKAAVEFIEYFTNAENASRWAQSLVAYTPYKDAAELPEYQEFVAGNIALTALGQQLDYAYVLPAFTGANTVRDEIKALVQRAASGQMSAAEAIALAVEACEEAMND